MEMTIALIQLTVQMLQVKLKKIDKLRDFTKRRVVIQPSLLAVVLTLVKNHHLILDLQPPLINLKKMHQLKKKSLIYWLPRRRHVTPIGTMTWKVWLLSNIIWKLVKIKQDIISVVISWHTWWPLDILIDTGNLEISTVEVEKHQCSLLKNIGTLMVLSKNQNSTKDQIIQKRHHINVLMKVSNVNVRVRFTWVWESDRIMVKKLRLSKIFFPLEDFTKAQQVAHTTLSNVLKLISQTSKEQVVMVMQEFGLTSQIFQNNVGASLKSSMNHITAQAMEVNAHVKMVMCSTVPNLLKTIQRRLLTLPRCLPSKWLLSEQTKLTMLLVIHQALRVSIHCQDSRKSAIVMTGKTSVLS